MDSKQNNVKTLYVGGLADDVDVNILKSAFAPFGDIMDVSLPIDYKTQKHKGFAFIEFQLPEDAADAIDNMNYGEILGKTIKVKKQHRHREATNRPIWADDEYLRKHSSDQPQDNQEAEEEVEKTADEKDSE